ncbi:MAG: acyl--CoA ligase [Deltaproteobacteria bacterium]|nr:acyl--CoA ligase [Deltaproteobacteria bacterium]
MPAGFRLVQDFLSDAAARLPGKTALVCGSERLSYAELEQRAAALASALTKCGVARADRVLVLAENGVAAATAIWAVLKANAVFAVIHPTTRADRLAWYLEHTRATALITEGNLEHRIRSVILQSRHLKTVVVDGQIDDRAAIPNLVDFAEAIGVPTEEPPRRGIDIDLASIIYTSGSTGEPKGVMLTHRNMLAAADSISSYLGSAEDDVILGALPLSFDYGLYQLFLAARSGARLVLERSFALPAPVLRRMVTEGITAFPGVPTFFALLAVVPPGAYDLSRVRYVTSTGAALSLRHIETVQRLFPNARLFSMYGLTECKRCTYLPPEDLARKPRSVGIAIPNTELWVVGADGRRLGANEVGELVVRGATVMRGYWADPEATAARLKPGPLPNEQVLYTGDLCQLDEAGYLTFVGRRDDVFKSRGEKVAPSEIEAVLAHIDGVREAAVVGFPDEVLGMAVKAFVVLEPRSTVTASILLTECRRRLASHMVPRCVELVAQLPRTSTGKVDRHALQSWSPASPVAG